MRVHDPAQEVRIWLQLTGGSAKLWEEVNIFLMSEEQVSSCPGVTSPRYCNVDAGVVDGNRVLTKQSPPVRRDLYVVIENRAPVRAEFEITIANGSFEFVR